MRVADLAVIQQVVRAQRALDAGGDGHAHGPFLKGVPDAQSDFRLGLRPPLTILEIVE